MKASVRRELESVALEVRKDVVRMTGLSRSGHLRSCLSVVDIIVYLYWKVLRIRPEEPHWPERDRLVFSKNHACPALYAVLARRGFFEREELWNYRRLGAMLQGRPEHFRTPGVDAPGGSGGMGIGLANGLLMSARMDRLDRRVFCVMGDGELQMGAVWESAMQAASLGSGALTTFVDMNGIQTGGSVESIKRIEPVRKKFEAFGWRVMEVDGHDFRQLEKAVAWSLSGPGESPSAVLAKTVPGKGVTIAEKGLLGPPACPLDRDRMEQALRELESSSGGRGGEV